MEYRPFPDERADEFRAFMRYAFSPHEGPYDPEAADDDREHLADYRGLFDGDEPVAVCGHHDFTLRLRGADRDVAGLSAVASPPEHRRQGNVARLLGESLAEYHDDGVHFSVLWPFEYAFYRRYGWATVSRYRHLTTPPAQLAFVDDLVATDGDAAGAFRRLGVDDYPSAQSVLAAMAERYDCTMARTEAWWRERTLRGWKTDPFVYGWERDGELRAFLSYTFDDEGDETVMNVSDVAVVDAEAWLQVLRFCRNHDSQVGEVRLRAPPDANLLDRVADPRAVTVESRTGPMFRLVDVVGSFEALAPDPAVDATFTLAVDDPLAAWNDRTFRVAVADGSVSVAPTAAADARDTSHDARDTSADGAPDTAADGAPDTSADGAPDTAADVATDVETLSALYAGYYSVDDAVQYGACSIDPSDGAAGLASDLDALFPPRTTHLRERF